MWLADAAFGLLLLAIFVAWYDWGRTWVFAPPSMIHVAFDAAYRERRPGASVTRFRWWTKAFTVVVDPKKAGRVLNNAELYADDISPVWSAFWGEATPFLMHGNAAHKAQRRLAAFLLQPAFAEEMRPHIREAVERWSARFDDGEWHEVGMESLNELTWHVICSLSTGADTPDWRQTTIAEIHNARLGGLAASALGTAVLPLLARLTRYLQPGYASWTAFVRRRIAEERAGLRSSPLLRALCAQTPAASDEEVFGVLVALHIGGHHGPSAVLSWALFHLLADPALLAEARSRIDDEPFMAATLAEAARLYPGGVVSRFYRARADDPHLGVRRGETVVVPWHSLHRDGGLNAQPAKFDPGRKQAAGAFFPFGLGAHSCAGQRLVRPVFSEALRLLIGRLECRLDSAHISYHSQLVTAEMDASMRGTMWARTRR